MAENARKIEVEDKGAQVEPIVASIGMQANPIFIETGTDALVMEQPSDPPSMHEMAC